MTHLWQTTTYRHPRLMERLTAKLMFHDRELLGIFTTHTPDTSTHDAKTTDVGHWRMKSRCITKDRSKYQPHQGAKECARRAGVHHG